MTVDKDIPSIIAISGVKNSGKTTFLEGLIAILKSRGISLAVVKHDGHEFQADVAGTDSHRLREAGAKHVAIYSDTQYMVISQKTHPCLETIMSCFPKVDLILLEGGKFTSYPKIEIVRNEVSQFPICDKETLLGIATDTDCYIVGIPSFELNNYEKAATIICEYIWRNDR